ncbi:MAG: MMPL family transporter [Chloroflexia bacterium]|nr:MMPL family transporter [Chloroflexia bacterium]
MTSRGFTGNMARRSATHPWITLIAWIVLLGAGIFFASGLGDVLTTDANFTNDPESVRGEKLIEERLRADEPLSELMIVRSDSYTVDDPEFRAFVDNLLAQVTAENEIVGSAVSFYQTGAEEMVATDRSAMMIPVALVGDFDEATEEIGSYLDVVEANDGQQGFQVVTGGDISINEVFNHTAEQDLLTGEIIGIPSAILILVLVFGALLAAGVPLVMAIISIVISLGITALVGLAFDLSIFVMNMIFMIGLAVGIDYSLFIVGRYREELAKGREKIEAITRTGETASKAVLFSGATVVVALFGMLLVPSTIFQSLGAGAIIVATVSVIATLTLLPALLSLMGGWINKGRLPFVGRMQSAVDEGGFWSRVARVVMRRPVISVVLVVAFLAGMSSVYFTINLGQSGVSTLPQESTVYRAFTMLESEFNGGSLQSPVDIVVDAGNVNTPEIQASIDNLIATLAADPMFGPAVVETNEAGNLALVSVPTTGDNQSTEALAAVERIQNTYAPAAFSGTNAEVLVTGPTAFTVDFNQMVSFYTPLVFLFVLGMSFILLLLAFRSLVVPAKAIVMNLLSVGASYGLLVAVFQHGIGNELLGFTQVEMIETWVPLMMFTILFGLSMDYHVFLLSRIRERYDVTRDNAESVAYGVRSTAKIITGAALIMVAVFSGFAMGELVMFQQMGFGLATAVILDATIIRSVLVPASMKLLGDWNWYFPSWLSWLPHISVEGTPDEHEEASHGHVPELATAD